MTLARAGTEVEAANQALGLLGQPPIGTLDDNLKRARTMRRHFAGARDQVLREKWWSFATRRVRPAADLVDAIGTLKKRFPLPADCVRVRFLEDGEGLPYDDESGGWDIESGAIDDAGAQVESIVIVTNIASPIVCYTSNAAPVRLWWADFLTAFCQELASRGAVALGRSQSRADALHDKAAATIENASGVDSKEKSRAEVPRETSWTRARFGSR